MEDEKNLQANVNFNNVPELYQDLLQMVREDQPTDVSKFLKKLIMQEKARRAQLELPGMPAKKSGSRKAVTA